LVGTGITAATATITAAATLLRYDWEADAPREWEALAITPVEKSWEQSKTRQFILCD